MKEQNLKNHSQFVPLYHYLTLGLILLLLIGSIVNLVNSSESNRYSASLLVLVAVILGLVAFFARRFALKAQDRAIRAEENLRHFVATGKLLDSNLRLSQVIALRFASDDEFVALAQKAVDNKMRVREIKAAIEAWKADHHRV